MEKITAIIPVREVAEGSRIKILHLLPELICLSTKSIS